MKKVFITVAFLTSFFFIATSFSSKPCPQNDITYTENGSYSLTGMVLDGLCVGENITLEGDLHYAITIIVKPDGSYHETTHVNASSVRGIGASGKKYLFQESGTEVFKSKAVDCRLYFNSGSIMKIISPGSNSNYYMKVRTVGYFDACEQVTTVESNEITEECR